MVLNRRLFLLALQYGFEPQTFHTHVFSFKNASSNIESRTAKSGQNESSWNEDFIIHTRSEETWVEQYRGDILSVEQDDERLYNGGISVVYEEVGIRKVCPDSANSACWTVVESC